MALGANLLLYALARLAGGPFQVAPPGRAPEEVGLAAVALFTALPNVPPVASLARMEEAL